MEKNNSVNGVGAAAGQAQEARARAEWKAGAKERFAAAETQAEEQLDGCHRECEWDEDGQKPAHRNGLRGKIGRLPGPLRREVCQRLLQEQPARVILAWLNSLPEVKAALTPYFGDMPVSAQNLWHWRGTGFAEWQARTEREEPTRELAADALGIGAKA